MAKGLLVGVGIGALTVWLLVVGPWDPHSHDLGRQLELSQRVPLPPSPATGDDETASRAADERPLGWRSDSARAEPGVREGRGASTPASAVAALSARIEMARKERAWSLFRELLEALAATGGTQAEAKLIELMGDESLAFHAPMGEFFTSALKESALGGVADAALRRIELEMVSRYEGASPRSWLTLLALHGNARHLARLEGFLDDREMETEVIQSLVEASSRPEIADWVVTLYRSHNEQRRREVSRRLSTFARNNPESTRRFIEEEFAAAEGIEARNLGYAYGQSVTPTGLAQARRFLRGLRSPAQRLEFVGSVNQMRRKGLDIHGLEGFALAPVEELERLGPGADIQAVRRVRWQIERNEITWSARAVRVLTRAAETHPLDARFLREAAHRIEAHLSAEPSGWITAR
jgi:hypothetical protein